MSKKHRDTEKEKAVEKSYYPVEKKFLQNDCSKNTNGFPRYLTSNVQFSVLLSVDGKTVRSGW